MERRQHKHAQAHKTTRSYVLGPTDRSAGAGVPAPIYDDSSERSRPMAKIKPGHCIDRYIVHAPIGRGGMGMVYGAVDPSLGRRVAIKLVRASSRSEARRYTKRLRREALALARLSHPNIVGIYDFGTTSIGTFVAMELVRGQNLRQWLDEVDPGPEAVLDVMVAAGGGLAAAHAEGIVHRDFKPSNVMVAHSGQVKILDFGLARGTPVKDSWVDEHTESLLSKKLTRADVILGTHGYMAPEQLRGCDAGPKADQFSYCVTLYEALFGVRPFPGGNPLELAAAFADERRSEPAKHPRLPRRVHDVLERGLSLDPADRFESMDALLAELHRPRRRSSAPRIAVAIAAFVATAATSAVLAVWLSAPEQAHAGVSLPPRACSPP